MSKFTCFLLCVVAVSLNGVDAGDDDGLREVIKPFVMACAKEYDISEADLNKAKESHSIETLKPCFIACIFKKFKIMNDKGEYDLEENLAKLKEFVKNDDHSATLTNVMKKCASVNDEPVSDGTAGCERAVLLTKCFIENKSQTIL